MHCRQASSGAGACDIAAVLHIAEMLANAARVAPDAVAVTLDDDALTFGEIDAEANRIANGLRELWVGRGDRVLWWSDTSLEAVPGVRGARQDRCRVRAAERAGVASTSCAPVAEYARPRLLLVRCVALGPRDGAGRARPASRIPSVPSPARPTAPAIADLDERDPHVIFFTSGSTGRPKGVVLSHRANWLRTYVGATTTPGGAGDASACSRCSTWRAGRSRSAPGRAAGPCTSCAPPTRRRCCAPPRATARRGCTASRRCGRASSNTASAATTSSSLDEADTGTSATPPELLHAIKDALPHTRTRVFYGSTEAGPGVQLGDADLFRKPGSVGRRRKPASR